MNGVAAGVEPLGELGVPGVLGAAVAAIDELGADGAQEDAPGAAVVGLAAADVAAPGAVAAVEAAGEDVVVEGLVVAPGPTQAEAMTALVTNRAAARKLTV